MILTCCLGYYSVKHGRIEGIGVPVDVEVDPADAMETALRIANGSVAKGK